MSSFCDIYMAISHKRSVCIGIIHDSMFLKCHNMLDALSIRMYSVVSYERDLWEGIGERYEPERLESRKWQVTTAESVVRKESKGTTHIYSLFCLHDFESWLQTKLRETRIIWWFSSTKSPVYFRTQFGRTSAASESLTNFRFQKCPR